MHEYLDDIFPGCSLEKSMIKIILKLLLHHKHMSEFFSRFFIEKINESIHAEDVSGIIGSNE